MHYGLPIFLALFISAFIFSGLKIKKSIVRHICFNLAAVFIAFLLFELYFTIKQFYKPKIVFSGTFFDNAAAKGRKEFVGYGPLEDTTFQVSAIRKNGDSLIYSVKYTLSKGRRLVPNNNENAHKKVFFLGCSVTFGDGLNDDQTLPYFFSEFSNHRFNVINYGFSGYGPHQALKIVEEKILKNKMPGDSSVCIYSFIPEHYARAAGRSIWDEYGPCYKTEDNKLLYKGSFNDNRLIKQNYFTRIIRIIWHNSNLYQKLIKDRVSKKDALLVAEIVKTMNQQLKNAGIRFIVLIRKPDSPLKHENVFYNCLNGCHIEHYFVDSIIDTSNWNAYKIKGDWHPNEKYNRELARFFSKKIKYRDNL